MANYLYIAVLFVCFFDVVIKALLPSGATYTVAPDGSSGRMIAVCLALGIAFYSEGFKKCPNKWALWFIIFTVFASFHSPNLIVNSPYMPSDPSVFNLKPIADMLIFLFMFLGLISIEISQNNRIKIFKSLAWVGIIYSAYIICQYFWMDQIYGLVSTDVKHLSRHPQCGGFIGQPVFASAVLAMCLPFVIQYKKWFIPLIFLGLLATGNRTGWIAIALSMVFFFSGSKKYAFYAIVAYIGIVAFTMAIYWAHPNIDTHIVSSGRLNVWKIALQDIVHPTFPGLNKTYILSGLGIGSFCIFFPSYHHSIFFQAHNEYLEVLYGLHIIGLSLFMLMIWDIFKASQEKIITASLIAICVFCVTNAGWHIPQLQFLTIMLVGLVYNKEPVYVRS